MDFSIWFEQVSMSDARRARKGIKRAWKAQKQSPHPYRRFRKFDPGTFGIEIEFRIQSEESTGWDMDAIKSELEFQVDNIINSRRTPEYGTSTFNFRKSLRDEWWKFIDDKFPSFESIHDWEYENEEPEEPDREDYDDPEEYQAELEAWEEDHQDWLDKREEIEKEIDSFDIDDLKQKFIDKIIEDETWEEFGIEAYNEGLSDFDSKAEEYKEFLEELGWQAKIVTDTDGTFWAIHEDGDSVFELTSPILTRKDIRNLIKLFERAEYEQTDGGTSCHIHVGMPEDTDGFDLVVITSLVDESSLLKDLPGRQFDRFAEFSSELQRQLSYYLKSKIYSKEEFSSLLNNLERNFGVNISAFRRHGTVEFRYLSSEVLDTPDLIFQWINYFLTLPQIARRKKQIKIRGDIYLTRMSGGRIRVDKSPESKVRQEPESPEDLRKSIQSSEYEAKKEQLKINMARRYLNNMSLEHFLMIFKNSDNSSLIDSIKTIVTNDLVKKIPRLYLFMRSLHPPDPFLNNFNNFLKASKHVSMADILETAESVKDERFKKYMNTLSNRIVNLVKNDFKTISRNVNYWKQFGI